MAWVDESINFFHSFMLCVVEGSGFIIHLVACPPGRPLTPRATPLSIYYDRAPTRTTFISSPLLFRLISCLCRRFNDLLLLLGVIILLLLPSPSSSHAVGQCTLFRRIILRPPPPRTDRSSSITVVIVVIAPGTNATVPSPLCSSGPPGRIIISEEGRSRSVVAVIVHREPTTISRHRILRLQRNGGRKRRRISCHGGRRSA